MRLAHGNQASLPSGLPVPAYARTGPSGIVHFGIGAFHRAHQAWYTDACLNAGDEGWLITGVSMRSDAVAQQLNPQDGLYTLTERSGSTSNTRLIGAVRQVLVAKPDRALILAELASPACHIVSFTVTEKGYCRAHDGSLDFSLADNGFYPILGEALARRKGAGLPGITLLSCDNLAGNGRQLGRLMREWLEARAPQLLDWFDARCTTPDCMVDRIVPSVTGTQLDDLETRIGLRDEGAVFAEPFSQWVIEDEFAGPRPRWEEHGAQIVANVAPYETAKLRMLNGAHSLLAYVGLDAGYDHVHEAISDLRLRALVERLMLEEAAPTIATARSHDLYGYSKALLDRFSNPALRHQLMQIAMDGSQKIPQRWLETLAAHQEDDDLTCTSILTGIAAWLRHARGEVREVDDPLAPELAALWGRCGRHGIVDAVFGERGILASAWQPSTMARAFIEERL